MQSSREQNLRADRLERVAAPGAVDDLDQAVQRLGVGVRQAGVKVLVPRLVQSE